MIIRIDYDEPDVATYRGVIVKEGDGGFVFNTGDPVKDFRDAIDMADDIAVKKDTFYCFSSSCDSFVMDHDHLGWVEDEEFGELIVWLDQETVN